MISRLLGFSFDKNGNKVSVGTVFRSVPKVVYDDVVDYSSFRPDSEQTRNMALAGAGSTGQGVYDGDKIPSDDVVRVRSGKLDKTEVAKLQKQLLETYSDENDKKIADAKNKELEAINKARQEYLDKATGFSGMPKQ